MYPIALTVTACLRAGTRVDVAWAVGTDGFGAHDPAEAVALTPGGGRVGSLLAGALDHQLADVARTSAGGRLVDLEVGELEATAAGLSCGGRARCLVVRADELPAELWDLLLVRAPVALVTSVHDDEVASTALYTRDDVAEAGEEVARRFGGGASATHVLDDGTVATILWPVPTLVVVGAGAIADAVDAAAALLGWHTRRATDAATATGLVAALAPLDKLVVISHDLELAGSVLLSALDGEVGYIGALGSRRTQEARAEWLAYRGVTDLRRVHGPAGLDIGANTPAEIAVSVLAEVIQIQALAADAGRPDGTEG